MVDTATPDIVTALNWARGRIALADARLLLRRVLRCDAAHLVAYSESALDAEQWHAFQRVVERREAGEPVAYLVGEREFYGYSLVVTPAVLIPRHETELLVELALAKFGDRPRARVLDLGTGSGALAVALARELPDADVTAVDRSREALLIAMANAARLKASVSFVLSNWFSALAGDRFQLIVANPPYVAAGDAHLVEGDVRFEPLSALASGPEGLDDISYIVARSPHHLESNGWLFVEHGHDQALRVRSLMADAGFAEIASWRDLAGIERVTGGQWRGMGGHGTAA